MSKISAQQAGHSSNNMVNQRFLKIKKNVI